jgi:putative ABC transport system permease protein
VPAIISVGIAEWIAPLVGNFLEREVQLNLLNNPQLILFLIGIVLFTALFSGFYPAWVLSRFNPVKALKNRRLYSYDRFTSILYEKF